MTESKSIREGYLVSHPRFGRGNVVVSTGLTAVVRFLNRLEECHVDDLTPVLSVKQKIEAEQWDIPIEVINRIQAETITSINDSWGVFARSKIELLPHQLWVCHLVCRTWPTRWLIADDVGLGKTIEAGLILSRLVFSGLAKRILILTPASLVEQWQFRLRDMFDLRFVRYSVENDTPKADYWNTNNQVIASVQTLRIDRGERHNRLLESAPRDLVIVDESHHLNADEIQGYTLGYQLLEKLVTAKLAHSVLFFTGTPHRGKDFGFLAQLKLLRPDLFEPNRSLSTQISNLPLVMIRNNKYSVTDLKGTRLFRKPIVVSETYSFTPQERNFYDLLSAFIVQGKAYASRLDRDKGSAVILVLIAMQKLASSSTAAIKSAIKGRLRRIDEGRRRLEEFESKRRAYLENQELGSADDAARFEEEIIADSSYLYLNENEVPSLKKLLELGDSIGEETKICKILDVVESRFSNRSIVFFTEYKATQSLLLSALASRYGAHSVTFINGDDRIDNVLYSDGTVHSINKNREEAAEEFNCGKARFLVSTEAGGEGIDLQGKCHTLVHVDLPWNPMRLHQRVGRLNRYGQTEQVEVLSLTNPETIEALIWGKLNEKIDRISKVFSEVMEEPEDMLQLVLGMTSPSFYTELFSNAICSPKEKLSEWFDSATMSFGGRDILDTVKDLAGSFQRFDFASVSDRLPKVDLPDLKPFFELALVINGRRVERDGDRISFVTPNSWLTEPSIKSRYADMNFERRSRQPGPQTGLLGVGHKLVDTAIRVSLASNASLTLIPIDTCKDALFVFRVQDRVTDSSYRPSTIIGIEIDPQSFQAQTIPDWRVLKLVNELPVARQVFRDVPLRAPNKEKLEQAMAVAEGEVARNRAIIPPDFRVPTFDLLAILWPSGA